MENILNIEHLKVWDKRNQQILVDDISFGLKKGQCLAIVGESGSGKSMTCRSILGLNKPWLCQSGNIYFEGKNLLSMKRKDLMKISGRKICMIMQSGSSAFDPSCKMRVHFRETLKCNLGYDYKKADMEMMDAMNKVLLKDPEQVLQKYPFQLSGGMLQRCMIAMAIALRPEIIIADEPTTALDLITQYEVICQFQTLREETESAMLFVSHDLGIVKQIADEIVVMKDGKLIEHGSSEDIFNHPKEMFTRHLIDTKKAMGQEFNRVYGGKKYAGSETCQ